MPTPVEADAIVSSRHAPHRARTAPPQCTAPRRVACGPLLPLALALAFAGPAAAQNYPNKPIRLVIPFAPGGGTDITARAIALKLYEAWGQPVLADNRTGANGTIGVDLAAKAAPDGYTLTMISSSHSVNTTLYRKLPYDLVRDLTPITQATTQPYALVVHPSVPAKSLKELMALARAKPGSLNYGSSGTGGLSHLSGAYFANAAGIELVHVPYKGGAPAMSDVIAGQIQMLFSTILQSHAHIKAGRLRAIAVTTKTRSRAEPAIPTMAESGLPGFEVAGWYGVLAPAKTPPQIVAQLNREIVRILRLPEMSDRLAADGSEPVGSSPEEFGAHIRAEIARWRKVVEAAGIRVE